MKEISNFDFDRIFRNNKHYAGTYCKDVIPKLQNKFYFINLCDEKDDEGTHWCVCVNTRPNNVFFFCPFGMPAPEHALKRMKATGKNIYYNDMDIQDFESTNCGYYCVYVVQQLEKGRKFADVVLDFDLDTPNNERMIETYSKKNKIRAGAGIFDKVKSVYNKIAPSFLQPSKRHTKAFQNYLNTHGKDDVIGVSVGQKPVQGAVSKALNIASLGKFNEARKKLGYNDLIHSYLIVTTRNKKGEITHTKVERNHKIAAVAPSGDDYKNLYKLPLKNKQTNFNELLTNASRGDENFDIYDPSFRQCQDFVNSVVSSNELEPSDEVKEKLKRQDGKTLIKSLGPLEPLPKLLTGIANVGEHIKEKIPFLGNGLKRNKKGQFIKQPKT